MSFSGITSISRLYSNVIFSAQTDRYYFISWRLCRSNNVMLCNMHTTIRAQLLLWIDLYTYTISAFDFDIFLISIFYRDISKLFFSWVLNNFHILTQYNACCYYYEILNNIFFFFCPNYMLKLNNEPLYYYI